MTDIILHGCNGAMGQAVRRIAGDLNVRIVAGISGDLDVTKAAGIDLKKESVIPGDLAVNKAAGISGESAAFSEGFPVFAQIADCDIKADAILDFSLAEAVSPLIRYAVKNKLPSVICTTGLTPEQENEIEKAAEVIALFHSSNMSLGISLLTTILQRVSRILYNSGFDIEILEKHHNRKIDAPSGTAYMLANTVNASIGNVLQPTYNRSQRRERREHNELGLSSIRGGTICGEHSVIFAGKDELLEFKHTAFSREIYAVGALNAAKYIKDKAPGIYTMESLINLEEL